MSSFVNAGDGVDGFGTFAQRYGPLTHGVAIRAVVYERRNRGRLEFARYENLTELRECVTFVAIACAANFMCPFSRVAKARYRYPLHLFAAGAESAGTFPFLYFGKLQKAPCRPKRWR